MRAFIVAIVGLIVITGHVIEHPDDYPSIAGLLLLLFGITMAVWIETERRNDEKRWPRK